MEFVMGVALSFPVVVFSVLIPLLLLYWVLVALRLAPLELFEHDSLKGDYLASSLVALGFVGVPASVSLSVLLGLAAAITLTVELVALRWLALGLFRVPLGIVVLWGAFAVASPLAAALCHSMRRWFHRYSHIHRRCLLGELVEVRSAPDAEGVASAILLDDPQCEVRLQGKAGSMPRAGERRVLVKYLVEEGTYRSVEDGEFREARAHLRRLRLGGRRSATAA
ncbi:MULTISPECIES: hypothetical protein [unclassified Halomonas]|uniref:hypothetical protein n=1 Tax=unclassified Halomonas TaxID=2609666 RepID=UPI0028850825|nr:MULTISPECIES: hypothetical protein [unclassified Halomonas]MDT0501600.1 hypothetical protein [Halomonas sp. PAR7]MDT0511043.1 hypothetical protein [Halomonas sp. LES1]MDT0592440.1 hypothetical protein [Halomonas sp. PAR8]